MEAGGDRREPVGVVESSGGRGLLCNLQQETLPSVQSRGASRDSRGPRQRTRPPCVGVSRLMRKQRLKANYGRLLAATPHHSAGAAGGIITV